MRLSSGWLLGLLCVASCGSDDKPEVKTTPPVVLTASPATQTMRVDITAVETRFDTRDHMMAALEMQLSGEPLAEAMGRDLGLYSRDHIPGNLYYAPELKGEARPDSTGFSAGIESYEYSKQPMNNLALESGAGTSLTYGSLLNPTSSQGPAAVALLRARVQKLAGMSNATSLYVTSLTTPANPLGWPGLWPTLHPFVSFDPAIKATDHIDLGCSITSDDDPGASGSLLSDDYECDYTTLHLIDRDKQVTKAIGPGASGWAGWKQALWTLNYLQVMHDAAETAVDAVDEADMPQVGTAFNTVIGQSEGAPSGAEGVYVGSSNIEGFQAGMFLDILDNQADSWLFSLSTTDGTSLSGFPDLKSALSYSTSSPPRWIPGEIKVQESSADGSGFPQATSYSISSPDSHLLDLAGIMGSFASIYALTDHANLEVGGSQPARVYFDGDPFPEDNQIADGEPTLHDRALAMVRMGVVNYDRLHVDPTSGLPVDDATPGMGASVTRGKTLSIDSAAYSLLALRTARRSLTSQLGLYSNTKPDARGISTPLDTLAPQGDLTFGGRLDQLIDGLSRVFLDKLSTDTGVAYAGWDIEKSAVTDDGTSLDAHTAAIRGLLVAYLATGDAGYRTRALHVFQRLEHDFYDPAARLYRLTPHDTSTQITYTPRRFGLLQASLRDMYELVALLPGNEPMQGLIEARIGRLNKLVLNGWDDRDQDNLVAWPDECGRVVDGLPRGGLQMAERTLSGETGSLADTLAMPRVLTTDREQDCVPEIAAAGLPSALANSITFTLSPMK